MNGPPPPVAIVGMACRFSGAPDLDAFWRLLAEGRNGRRPVPADRYPIEKFHDPASPKTGRIITREGGFIDDVWGFDAGLFRLSHREASSMDPQHRQLLEVAWSAVLDAGIPTDRLDGARGCVYTGLFTGDFRDRLVKRPDPDLDIYLEIGTTRSSAAGRISHALNLNGHACAVDSACASSLTAITLACQDLWLGQADIGLAGGTNLILEPETTVCFSRSGMLAADALCKFGDARADGFVRSEGVAMLVLKRLEDAERDGDRVYAVIRAAAAANDGRQGQGLFMTPSTEGQMTLLERVYVEAGLDPARLFYVEAHGTGTKAGDPVETRALAATVSRSRAPGSPLWVGSVKTNIGHTEGAAGAAGVMKTALALHHRQLPPSLHVEAPNPAIPWEEGQLAIPSHLTPLPEGDVLAGISSFGLSGTNAHVVLETYTAPAAAPVVAPDQWLLPISAHNGAALQAQAQSYAHALRDPATSLADFVYTAACRRAHLEWRGAVLGSGAEELASALEALGAATPTDPVALGRPVFVFSGQGGQWPGMGRALYANDAGFRAAFDRIDATFVAVEGWSPKVVLDGPPDWTRDIARIQPLIVAVQIALAETLKAHGVVPTAVVGHSMGEAAAAAVCGALTVEDAVRVICLRSRLMTRIAGRGAMGVVGVGAAAAREAIAGREDRVSVAVSNAKASTVISGEPAAVDEVLAALSAKGIYCRRVDVDVASHSPQTEALLDDLRAGLAGLQPRDCAIPFYSTVEAAILPGSTLGPDYWVRNLRQPVRFLETTVALVAAGHQLFLECSPHPVLLTPLGQTLRELDTPAVALPLMTRDEVDRRTLLTTLATLYTNGARLDWAGLVPRARVTRLPEYPFQHEEFRVDRVEDGAPAPRAAAVGRAGHPWLGAHVRLGSGAGAEVWETPLSVALHPWLADHKVRGSVVLPGAGYAEMLLGAAVELRPAGPWTIEDLDLRETLIVPSARPLTLQLQLDPQTGDARFYAVDGQEMGKLHARARLVPPPPRTPPGESAVVLLHERLERALQRMARNPRQGVALLGVETVAQADSLAVTERLRAAVRGTDAVHRFGMGARHVLLLAGVTSPAGLAAVAGRVGAMLGELSPVRLSGQVLSHDAGAADVAGQAVRGELTPLDIPSTDGAPDLDQDAAAFYAGMTARGLQYGPRFQVVQRLTRSGSHAEATLLAPEAMDGFVVHPALLDGCLQAAISPFAQGRLGDSDTVLPIAMGRLTLFRRPEGPLKLHAWERPIFERPDEIEVDFVVLGADGAPVVECSGFRVRRFAARLDRQDPEEAWRNHWTWLQAPMPHGAREAGTIRIVAEPPAMGDALREALIARGARLVDSGARVTIHLSSPERSDDARALMNAAIRRDVSVLGASRDTAMLWIVSMLGCQVRDDDGLVDPTASTLWGLGRVLAKERPDLAVRLVDIGDPVDDATALAELILNPDAEDESALRGGARYVHRMAPGAGASLVRRAGRTLLGTAPFTVDLSSTTWTVVEGAPAAYEPGEALVRVDRIAWDGVGIAAAWGRVVAAGPYAGAPPAGTAVLVWEPPERLRASRYLAVPGTSLLPAANPHALHAAWWGPARLVLRQAGIRGGDRVLVLGASSPLGAAIARSAAAIGAEVYATAGSYAERAALKEAGVRWPLEPGSAALAAELLDLSDGAGMQVVIHLDGTVPDAIAPGGRVLAMGDAPGLPRSDVRLALYDVPTPEGQAAAMREAIDDPPLTLPVVPLPLSRTRGTRAVILDLDVKELRVDAAPARRGFVGDASYLVTGGVGALGLALGEWLAQAGAGTVVLMSRGVRLSADAEEGLARIRAGGANVVLMRGDVGDAEDVDRVVREIDEALPPLRGVFHLAGVLDDATWDRQDAARFATVMRPKVMGAWNLHRALLGRELDHFVLYSSAAAMLGSPGQGNYTAANSFLDGLAVLRHQLGLPACSIAWGVWGGGGLAMAQDNRGNRLAHQGLGTMPPELALAAMAPVLHGDTPAELGIFDLDWGRWAQAWPIVARSPSVSGRVPATAEAPTDGDLKTRLAKASPEARKTLLATAVKKLLSEVLRLPVHRIPDRQPLTALGLDSLMAVELQAKLQAALGVELAPPKLLGLRGVDALNDLLLQTSDGPTTAEAPSLPHPQLDPDIVPPTGTFPPLPTQQILLTGATGFVGAWLLRELLDLTDARVVCLVRARDEEEARDRLREHLMAEGLLEPGDLDRIVVELGDLAQPWLGLSPGRFRELGDTVDVIHHCGAWVNHVYPYEELAPTNVGGTQEVLRLAATGRPKVVHHVSTIGIFPFTTELGRAHTYTELDLLPTHPEPFFGGYAESKWAAEQLVEEARRRGIDVRIYRAGLVTGSSRRGRSPETDAVWRIVHAIASLGLAPDFAQGLALTPVDYVARAMVELSQADDAQNANFHLFNRRKVGIPDLVDTLGSIGVPVRVVPIAEFRAAVQARIQRESPLFPLLPKLLELDLAALDTARIAIDCTATLERVGDGVIGAYEVDRSLLRAYLDHFVRIGFLQPPREERATG